MKKKFNFYAIAFVIAAVLAIGEFFELLPSYFSFKHRADDVVDEVEDSSDDEIN